MGWGGEGRAGEAFLCIEKVHIPQAGLKKKSRVIDLHKLFVAFEKWNIPTIWVLVPQWCRMLCSLQCAPIPRAITGHQSPAESPAHPWQQLGLCLPQLRLPAQCPHAYHTWVVSFILSVWLSQRQWF